MRESASTRQEQACFLPSHRLRELLALLALPAACACSVSDPPLTGDPINRVGEQAETHAVVARRPNGSVNLVVGHRFTGPYYLNNNKSNPPDILYLPPDSVSFRRGSSIMGWSYSASGTLWNAPGKVYPQNVWGEQVAILWSDPALAVGLANPSLVAYASLAASAQAFDEVTAASEDPDTLHGWPANTTTPAGFNLVDSVCVTLSFDGGVQFGDLVCAREPDIGTVGTDQTTVAIGAGDRVYVAVDDYDTLPAGPGGRILLYELIYTGVPTPLLKKVPVDSQMGFASKGPELRRDQAGGVWLSGMDAAGSLRLCRVTDLGCTYVGQVTSGAELFATLPAGVVTPKPLQTAVSGDFAVNRLSLGSFPNARQFIFAYSRLDAGNGNPYIAATLCVLPSLGGTLGCQDIADWSTAPLSGYQIQPDIELVDKSPSQDGSGADWRYAFYEFGGEGVGAGRAQVTLATLLGVSGGDALGVTFSPLPGPDPLVCPAYYSWSDVNYWGDYFALLAVPPIPGNPSWRHLAINSSDEGRGCNPSAHPLQGDQLHVTAWGWVD